MYDIVSIGGLTYDLFAKAHASKVMQIKTAEGLSAELLLPYGGKMNIDEVHETLGGGANNTSIAFARMGLKAACCGLVGDDLWGKSVRANLMNEGVKDELLSFTEDEKTSFSIILNSFEGERTVLNYPGANHLFTAEFFPLAKIMQTQWIFLNHLSGEANSLVDKVDLILEKKPEICLAWNPGGVQLRKGCKEYASILKKTKVIFLNKEEAELFTGKKSQQRVQKILNYSGKEEVKELNLMDEAFQVLHDLGVKIVVITDGRNGAQASDGKEIFYYPVLNQKRVDTLGAGDSFASGFVTALFLQKSLQTALKFGTMNATSVVNHYGAQKGLLTYSEIKDQVSKASLDIIKLK